MTGHFLNIEDKGGWLFVLVWSLNGSSVQYAPLMRLWSTASELHAKGKAFVDAYLENSGAINANAWSEAPRLSWMPVGSSRGAIVAV